MKKLVNMLAIVLLASSVCLAQENVRGSEYGFTYKKALTSTYSWTNDNAYPFKISSMQFNYDTATTGVVTRIRPSVTFQTVGNVVSTNPMGGIETNYSWTITNKPTVYLTNVFLSVTNSGSVIYDTDDIVQQYILMGDVLRFNFGSGSRLLIFDATR